MKKKNYASFLAAKSDKIISTLIGKHTCFMLVFSFAAGLMLAQDGLPSHKTLVGVSFRTEVSGDGYGGKYLPGFFISKGRGHYGLNAIIQTRNSNFAGLQFNYNYALTGATVDCERGPELYVAFFMAYHHKGMLGRTALRNERMANPESSYLDLENLCFRSVEAFIGFGLKVELFKNFKWSNSVGLGGYSSLSTPVPHLYYASSGLGLRVSSGFSYVFN